MNERKRRHLVDKELAIKQQLDYIELQFRVLRGLVSKRCTEVAMKEFKSDTPLLSRTKKFKG